VCEKEGCWSSNHSKEEREESRKKFKARFSQRFNKYTRQYIADYKGSEASEDDLDSVDEAIEAMIVTDKDDQSDPELVEQFMTSFGVLGPQTARDITTTLANQSLTHALTSTDTTASPSDSDSDPFVYTTTDRYTSDVFYGIMIDMG
jgi:signal recognition particle GTPase